MTPSFALEQRRVEDGGAQESSKDDNVGFALIRNSSPILNEYLKSPFSIMLQFANDTCQFIYNPDYLFMRFTDTTQRCYDMNLDFFGKMLLNSWQRVKKGG